MARSNAWSVSWEGALWLRRRRERPIGAVGKPVALTAEVCRRHRLESRGRRSVVDTRGGAVAVDVPREALIERQSELGNHRNLPRGGGGEKCVRGQRGSGRRRRTHFSPPDRNST